MSGLFTLFSESHFRNAYQENYQNKILQTSPFNMVQDNHLFSFLVCIKRFLNV